MKVGKLIDVLKKFDGEAEVFVSSDEELNTIFRNPNVAVLKMDKPSVVIWGNTGDEVDGF